MDKKAEFNAAASDLKGKIFEIAARAAPVTAEQLDDLKGMLAKWYHPDFQAGLKQSGIKLEDSNMNSPMHVVAWNGYMDCVQALIEAGAELNVENKYGDTPMDVAVKMGLGDVARLLYKAAEDLETAVYERGLSVLEI